MLVFHGVHVKHEAMQIISSCISNMEGEIYWMRDGTNVSSLLETLELFQERKNLPNKTFCLKMRPYLIEAIDQANMEFKT